MSSQTAITDTLQVLKQVESRIGVKSVGFYHTPSEVATDTMYALLTSCPIAFVINPDYCTPHVS